MTRKEEITILVKSLKEDFKVKTEKLAEFSKQKEELIVACLKNVWSGIAPTLKVELKADRTIFLVKTNEEEFFSELTIRHPWRMLESDIPKGDYELGWFASNAKKADLKYLVYLELTGFVAREMRTDGILMATIKEVLPELLKLDGQISEVAWKIRDLEQEFNRLEREEEIAKITANGGVKFEKSVYIFIGGKSNRVFDRKRGHNVKEIKIGKVTDKTTTLHYIDDVEFEVKKHDKVEAERILLDFVKKVEELKEYDKKMAESAKG